MDVTFETMRFIKTFSEITKDDIAIAGGKGASLGEMVQAGIPVPPGFVILRSAFDRVFEDGDFDGDVEIPEDIEEEILTAFKNLDAKFVAVRSSATAEDSSLASWAGELETFLNTTEVTLIENIKECWLSLFSARASAYREEQGLEDADIAVAVVIQKMVQSDVAGIAFTVHPVTKDRNQMIIEAAWGLGELIVGGMVTPDSYVIDKPERALIAVDVSEQEEMLIRGDAGNDMVEVPWEKRESQKLDTDQITTLTELCITIERHSGFPCDIEWAVEDNEIFILQSRPITTL